MMNRREFLECATLMITGMSASQVGFTLSLQQRQHLSMAPPYIAREPDYFSDSQRQTVAAIADTIIPSTETPGAIEAGVPRYIELMVADWFNQEERDVFDKGLAALMQEVDASHGAPFSELPESERIALLEQLEDSAADAPYYSMSANLFAGSTSVNPFIALIKELTTYGFFTSEVGSKQVLRYNPVPMKFEGDTPLGPDDSSWAGGML